MVVEESDGVNVAEVEVVSVAVQLPVTVRVEVPDNELVPPLLDIVRVRVDENELVDDTVDESCFVKEFESVALWVPRDSDWEFVEVSLYVSVEDLDRVEEGDVDSVTVPVDVFDNVALDDTLLETVGVADDV